MMTANDLHIIHLDTEKGWGGGQNQVLLLLQELLSRGYGNLLLTPEKGELWQRSSPLLSLYPDRFHLVRVRQANQADIRDLPAVLRFLKKEEVSSCEEGQISKDKISTPEEGVLRKRKAGGKKNGIIHLHSWRGILFALLLSSLSGHPLVVTRRINYKLGLFSSFLLNRSRFRMVAISEGVKKSLQESGFKKETAVVRSGIPVENFPALRNIPGGKGRSFRERLGLDEGEILVGHVGAFNAIKGQEYLLEAIASIASTDLPVKGAFAGDGPELPELKEKAEKKNLHDRVFFLGELPDVREFLASIDILAVPSLVEGLGIAAIEAMASGIPVVAFRTGGLAEVVENGVTGFLVPAADVPALSEKLLQLVRDKDLRSRMGAEGKKRAGKEFSCKSMVDSYEKIYREELKQAV